MAGDSFVLRLEHCTRDRAHLVGGKATGLGNNTNPLKYAWARRFDRNTNDRAIGNVFGSFAALPELALRTQFSFNLFQGQFTGFTPTTFENAEANATNGIVQNDNRATTWTFTNTLTYSRSMAGGHNLALLLGQEANSSTGRFMSGGISGLLNDAPADRYIDDALGQASTKTVSSTGFFDRLLSFFGKADYNYGQKYYASATLRRDGSSKFAKGHQWGTFPAFNVGWRLSRESFFPQDGFLSNVMLRFGWGVTGNQNIPGGRVVAKFGGGTGDTFYDIGGSQTSIQPGFRQIALGNPNIKWEENKSTNVGVDLEFLHGRGNLTVDVYNRVTDNMLFDPRPPATAGAADPAVQNVGKMSNKGRVQRDGRGVEGLEHRVQRRALQEQGPAYRWQAHPVPWSGWPAGHPHRQPDHEPGRRADRRLLRQGGEWLLGDGFRCGRPSPRFGRQLRDAAVPAQRRGGWPAVRRRQ